MRYIGGIATLAAFIAASCYLLSKKDMVPDVRLDIPGIGDIRDKLPKNPLSGIGTSPISAVITAPILAPGPAVFWWLVRRYRSKR